MAATYHLICLDCSVYLSPGKVYSVTERGEHLGEVTVDGVYDPRDKRWHRRDEVFGCAMEGFLFRHRNHELRFVPEGVDELLDTVEKEVESLALDNVLSPNVDEFDPASELDEWRRRLAKLR